MARAVEAYVVAVAVIVLGLALLVTGFADPGLKWNPVLTGIDIVVTGLAGGLFALVLPAPDLAPTRDLGPAVDPAARAPTEAEPSG
jgi:hypothetical protein